MVMEGRSERERARHSVASSLHGLVYVHVTLSNEGNWTTDNGTSWSVSSLQGTVVCLLDGDHGDPSLYKELQILWGRGGE